MADKLDFIEELREATDGVVDQLYEDSGRSVIQGIHILMAVNAVGDSFDTGTIKIAIGRELVNQRNFVFWDNGEYGLTINAEELARALQIAFSEIGEPIDLEAVECWLSNVFMIAEASFVYRWQGPLACKAIAQSLHHVDCDEEIDLPQMIQDLRGFLE